jgi:hypothetical protein
MPGSGGFVYVVDETRRADQVIAAIESGGKFTDALSVRDWGLRQAQLALISVDGQEILYAALARKGNRVATAKARAMFSNLVTLDNPLPLTALEFALPGRLESYLTRATSGLAAPLPPQLWARLFDTVKARQKAETAGALEHLARLVELDPETFLRAGSEIVADERDAVNIALRIAGFDEQNILRWSVDRDQPVAPFLQGLGESVLREDTMVAHDHRVFGDWEIIREAQVGAVEFAGRGGKYLTIVNANRTPIEQTLGVDLIYYFADYESYLLVQYKRMLGHGDELGYRLNDDSYTAELERMRAFRTAIGDEPIATELNRYRLSPEGFYFKLCPATVIDPTSPAMITGMYFPLDLWEVVVNSDAVRGPRGGRSVRYANVPRYLNNSLFIDLAQAGWIGTRGVRSATIGEIVRGSLEGKRSVILAAGNSPQRERRRRFPTPRGS